MKVFGRFWYQVLMDFLKIWHEGTRHEVLWHIFRCFSNFEKNRFYKGFPKNIGFSRLEGFKTQSFEISRYPFCRACHFTSILLFLCGWLKTLFFANFLTSSRFWLKLAWTDPHKNVNFSKNFQLILTKFCHSMSNWCRIRYTKFCVDICNGYGVILEKPGREQILPPPQRGAC